jgi:hypothetical protein
MYIIRSQVPILPFTLRRQLADEPSQFITPQEQFEQTAAIFGAPGSDGVAGTTFEHVQSTPASQWTVNHNLGRRPTSVRVLSAGGVEVEAGITEMSMNQLVVDFSVPYVGRVIVT